MPRMSVPCENSRRESQDPSTLAHFIDSFRVRGSDTAYVRRHGYRISRWSYRAVADSIDRLACSLAARGVSPGDRVLLWGEDCAEWVVGFWACVASGAVAVPLERTTPPEFARRILHQTDARICICSRAQPALDPSLPAIFFEDLAALPGTGPTGVPVAPHLKPHDPVEIVFTSGTTADPKGVVLTHENILANIRPIEREIEKYRKYERLVHPIRFLNVVPLSHVFGQFLGLFIPPLLGSTVVFPDTLNPSEIIHLIRRERISVLVAVPKILDALRGRVERDLMPDDLERASGKHPLLRYWRFRSIHRQFGLKFWAIISGGATLSPDMERFWGTLGFAVIQGYGLTETTSLISVNHPFKKGKGTVGKVLPGREVRLSEEGEILVRGGNVAKSYFHRREIRSVSGEEGWFHTGDLGAIDEQGNLYFKGRRKNVIVTPEGMNIFPEDLESALRSQPGIADCVVVTLDRDGNAEPCAVLIPEVDKDPAEAVKRANQSLSEYQQIRRWLVWPEQDFPRTATQKPQTRIIQEYAARARGGSVRTGGNMVTEMISRISGGRSVSGSGADLNLSSIERVELLSALEDRLQLDLDESLFTAARTVADVEKVLARPQQANAGLEYPAWPQTRLVAFLRVIAYYLLSWPATLPVWPRVRGRENLRGVSGPLLFVSNHVTYVDIGFILAALPPRFRHRLAVAMMGEILQAMRSPSPEESRLERLIRKTAYRLVLALFNVFPLPQKSGFRRSFAFAGESVDRGYSILVFPEGTRTRDGAMSPFRAGVGILATSLNIPVVPIRIDGLFELKNARRKWARPGSVQVTIGSPVRYGSDMDPAVVARDLQARTSAVAG